MPEMDKPWSYTRGKRESDVWPVVILSAALVFAALLAVIVVLYAS